MKTIRGNQIRDTYNNDYSGLNPTQKADLAEDFLELSHELHELAAQLAGQE